MNQYFAYTRVSTARQGEGVSLQQQKDAIERYAQRGSIKICRWFEERETAARAGRPVFEVMVRQLRKQKARGVLIHKIDRSARNLRDWADLGDLIDRGVDVHFVNEGLDLNSRGGRLSADIQAVVAADFIRNLKEETRKGFYGRLKQGVMPMPAPLGYLNVGPGQPKVIDPKNGPLVRHLFECYASGRFNFASTLVEARRIRLIGRFGKPLTKNGLTTLLNNPFYTGLIRIKRTGESFIGAHSPLISKDLFSRVQSVLRGKSNTKALRHDFLFRRRIQCQTCRYHLIGQTARGHVYYRCHTASCPTGFVREEAVEEAVLKKLDKLRFDQRELRYLQQELDRMRGDEAHEAEKLIASLRLAASQLDDRLNRLTDAFIDRLIDQAAFWQRKEALLSERLELSNRLAQVEAGTVDIAGTIGNYIQRADGACLAYQHASPDEKRDLLGAL
ncbi:MAG TPA: recombinase family protein, partial [Acidobacteriaceae bacterium]|nr:recombinase family protein [Acidobacteriaceae bacterium]